MQTINLISTAHDGDLGFADNVLLKSVRPRGFRKPRRREVDIAVDIVRAHQHKEALRSPMNKIMWKIRNAITAGRWIDCRHIRTRAKGYEEYRVCLDCGTHR